MDCLVALRPDLKLNLEAHPGQRWEGRIDMLDNGEQLNIELIATLHFAGALFEGQGRMSAPRSEGGVDISISGQVTATAAAFDIWLDGGDGTGLRLDCAGAMGAEAASFDGECSYVCGKPDTCACNGGHGPIRMWKIGAA